MKSLKLVADHKTLKMRLKIYIIIRKLQSHCNEFWYLVSISKARKVLLKYGRYHQIKAFELRRTINDTNLLQSEKTEDFFVLWQSLWSQISCFLILILREIHIINLYNALVRLSSQQNTNATCFRYFINRVCHDFYFLHMRVILFTYRNCWSHTSITLGLRIRQVISTSFIDWIGFSWQSRNAFWTWLFVLALISQLL